MTKLAFFTHLLCVVIVRIIAAIVISSTVGLSTGGEVGFVMLGLVWEGSLIWFWIVARHRLKTLGKSPRWTLFFFLGIGLVPIIMCLSNKKRIKHIYKENGRTYEEIEVVDEREWNEEENGDNNDDDEYDEKKKKKQQNKDTSMYDEVMQELVEEEKEKAKTLLKEKYREKVREHLLNGTEEKLFEVETKNEGLRKHKKVQSNQIPTYRERLNETGQEMSIESKAEYEQILTLLGKKPKE